MDKGPSFASRATSCQRAGVSARSKAGRSSRVSTRREAGLRPSATRFHAASKRSSASPGGPRRSSSTRAKAPPHGEHIALEVVAQLLDRAELIGARAAAQPAAAVLVLDQIAVAQAVTQVVVQLDLQYRSADD